MTENSACSNCKTSIAINYDYQRWFSIDICDTCCKLPEFKLITKTTAREEYILTESELNDSSIMPHIRKNNPYKPGWAEMCLYLRKQVEDFAIEKHGSLDKIAKERQDREDALLHRKTRKFNEKMKDLRKKTKIESKFQVGNEKATHVHLFKREGSVERCECGMQIESEEL